MLAGFLLQFTRPISSLYAVSGHAVSQRSQTENVVVRIEAKSGTKRARAGTLYPAPGLDQPGFTLVETIVAMSILTFVVVSLYAAFSIGFACIKVAREDLRADQILVQKLETLREYDWSSLTNGYVLTNSMAVFSSEGGIEYGVNMSITPAPVTESYSNTLRQVTASVFWSSGGGFGSGVTHQRSMTTLVSQNGLQTYKP